MIGDDNHGDGDDYGDDPYMTVAIDMARCAMVENI